MHHFIALSLIASLMGVVVATGDPVHRYAQLRAWGQPGCRASNLGKEGIFGGYIGSCKPLDKYDTVRSVSVESIESGCTLTSRQSLDCVLPLTSPQCTFTAICIVILNGLRFLLTDASVANTSIRCTNCHVMSEMYFSGSGSKSSNCGIWKIVLSCIVLGYSVPYAPQHCARRSFWEGPSLQPKKLHRDKIVRNFSKQTSQEIKNGLLKLHLSKLTFGFTMHQTHKTVPGWPSMSIGCGGLKEVCYHVGNNLKTCWIFFLWRLLKIGQCNQQS